MIQEYRKKSADIMFLNQYRWAKPLYKFTSLFWPSWQPDQDTNQREMIEDWLIEQGEWLRYEYGDYFGEIVWRISIINKIYELYYNYYITYMSPHMFNPNPIMC